MGITPATYKQLDTYIQAEVKANVPPEMIAQDIQAKFASSFPGTDLQTLPYQYAPQEARIKFSLLNGVLLFLLGILLGFQVVGLAVTLINGWPIQSGMLFTLIQMLMITAFIATAFWGVWGWKRIGYTYGAMGSVFAMFLAFAWNYLTIYDAALYVTLAGISVFLRIKLFPARSSLKSAPSAMQ